MKCILLKIDIAGVKAVAGKRVDLGELRKVPMFIFLGDKDGSDLVMFDVIRLFLDKHK